MGYRRGPAAWLTSLLSQKIKTKSERTLPQQIVQALHTDNKGSLTSCPFNGERKSIYPQPLGVEFSGVGDTRSGRPLSSFRYHRAYSLVTWFPFRDRLQPFEGRQAFGKMQESHLQVCVFRIIRCLSKSIHFAIASSVQQGDGKHLVRGTERESLCRFVGNLSDDYGNAIDEKKKRQTMPWRRNERKSFVARAEMLKKTERNWKGDWKTSKK